MSRPLRRIEEIYVRLEKYCIEKPRANKYMLFMCKIHLNKISMAFVLFLFVVLNFSPSYGSACAEPSSAESKRVFYSEPLYEGATDAFLCYLPLNTQTLRNTWTDFAAKCSAQIRGSTETMWYGDTQGVFGTFMESLITAVDKSGNDEFQESAVVYLSNVAEPLTDSVAMIEHVEMFMASHASKTLPFFNHIGIARSPFAEGRMIHKGVAMHLQSFGARCVQRIYGDSKRAMVTSPLESMAEIFHKALGDEVFFRCMSQRSELTLDRKNRPQKQITWTLYVGEKICAFNPFVTKRTAQEWYISNTAFSTNLERYAGIRTNVLGGWSAAHPYDPARISHRQ